MFAARMPGIAFTLILAAIWPAIASGQATKSAPSRGGVRCCGLMMRTEFGHPERMAELSVKADSALGNCIDSGKPDGLIEGFEAYLKSVETEFGDAEQRDVVRSRLLKSFRPACKDPARCAQLLEGFRKFAFASVLLSKGMSAKAIEETKQARQTMLRGVPADSFCLMPVDLYLVTALAESGDPNEAVTIAQSVVNRARTTYGPKDEFVGITLVGLGKAQMAAGDAKAAEATVREALGILGNALEIQPSGYLLNCNVLAESLLAQSKHAEAAELMAYLEPQIRTLLHDQLVPPVLNAIMMHAKALNGLEKYEESEAVLGKYPELILSMKEPGLAGRNLLEVSAVLLEKTDRAKQAAPARKCIARIDAKLANTTRR